MNRELIFISMHLPSPDFPQAGQKLAYTRLKKFTEEYSVHLVSFVNDAEYEYIREENYTFCKSVSFISLSNFNRLKNFIFSFYLPAKVAIRNDRRMKRKLNLLLEKYPVAHIHIEFEQGAVYLQDKMNNDTTVVFHDVISQSLARFAELNTSFIKSFFYKTQHKKMFRWEQVIIKKITNKIVLNEKDAKLIRDISDSVSNVYIDYPVVSDIYKKISRDKVIPGCLLFWGAMSRFENIDAVQWFVNDIFPIIVNEVPETKLFIVGSNPTEEVKLLESDKIVVTGYVDDPVPFFEKAHIAIVPLRYGAGIKIKVIEALAAGLDVVTTDVGAEGIIDQGQKLYIANSTADFAETIINIINGKLTLTANNVDMNL
ncbi:glycosyltransferase [Klebsiella sp. 2680]|uniref:glycosyltransferase n=1 Tax=Klebsiella sp. 2680 TaxID=2018037 RepID=UPI001158C302|nr:glycosyltransferase [Klebsiella sp. 2680]